MKLFISNEVIEKYGYAHFKGVDYDDYKYNADDEYRQDDDGIIYTRDDMYNIYLSVSEDDSCYTDIEDIRLDIELAYYTQYYNMRAVCDRANVNYSTFKGWKNNGYNMSENKKMSLLNSMKDIGAEIDN